MKVFSTIFCLFLLLSQATSLVRAQSSSHPRLWVTTNDLPRLRSWAIPNNPLYGPTGSAGLASLAAYAKSQMDVTNTSNVPPSPNVPYGDSGTRNYSGQWPTEMYAELFAFMSLLSTDPAVQADYAQRARTLVMYVMNQAILGVDTNDPPAAFRDSRFFSYDSDRPRYFGEGWALTVDWIYPYLSAGDKATIRTVFLRWASEIVNNAYAVPPTPQGVTNDPSLLINPPTRFGAPFNPVRWSGNNYYCAHMRNLGLMAMAFDPADDPGNQLRNYLSPATGGFLYIVDHLLRNDCRGGLLPEGFEYSPQTASYIVQFLYALHTAGQDNPAVWGSQVVMTNQPFWGDFIHAYLHSLSPLPGIDPENGASTHYAAWYGDGQHIFTPDFMHCLGTLGVFAYSTGDTNRLNDCRWIEQYLAPGGPDNFLDRASRNYNVFADDILAFMLYDPAAPPAVDPHAAEPLDLFVPGMGRILSRTGWDTNAAWFTYKLSWAHIDHQLCDGNQFEFFRRGEWLTSERTGYTLDAGCSDNHNTLLLENDPPNVGSDDYRYLLYTRGSQWGILSGGDPQILSHSLGSNYVAVTGDSTALYNSTYADATNILHASRSLVWLKPDHIIVFDRATSKTSNRSKQFCINTAAAALVTGAQATVTMPSDQKLFTATLLPTNAVVTSEQYTNLPQGAFNLYGSLAEAESMLYRVRADAPGGPADVRFLNVLQGADPSQDRDPALLVQSTAGTSYQGAQVKNQLVLFKSDLNAAFSTLTYLAATNVTAHYITDLQPNAFYAATAQPVGTNIQITIAPATSGLRADSGGVLVLVSGAQPIDSPSRLSNNHEVVSFSEIAAGPYYIQASTNLSVWTDIGAALRQSNGTFQFEDTNAPSFPMRFYRKVAR